jgi:hypothetical protein
MPVCGRGGTGVAKKPGKPVIPSAAKNLAGITEILRRARNDKKPGGTARTDRKTKRSVCEFLSLRFM